MSYRSPAQKRAIAAAIARKKSSSISGRGGYRKRPAYSSRKPVFRGRGDYKKDYGQRLGSVVGEGLQELLTQLGGIVGIGKAVGGMGSYAPIPFKVQSNKLAEGNDPPEVINGNDGSFVMRHREYVKDISCGASGAFQLEAFNINPGNETLFPWLSMIASRFEQYRVEGMVFEFRSNYGEATTGSMGTVITATEYEVNKPNFVNKVVMENHQYAASCKPSLSLLHPIECARSQTPLTELSVRLSADGTHPANDDEDARFCDLGKFQIASQGVGTAASILGELWVSYQIRFFKPRIAPELDSQASYYYNDTSITTAAPFGDVDNGDMLAGDGNNIDLTLLDGGFIQFPLGANGTYNIVCQWTFASEAATVANITGLVGCSQVTANNPWVGVVGDDYAPQAGATATKKMRVYSVTMTEGYGAFAQVQIQSGAQTTFTGFSMMVWHTPENLGTFHTYDPEDPSPAPAPAIPDMIAYRRFLKYEKEEAEKLLLNAPDNSEEELEEPDLTQSTAATINDIVLKARLKKQLLEKASK